MGRPARFDRATVLRAGLDLADERGLEGVTMQAVADRIGVTPMALYRLVAGKAELLDGLVEMLLTEAPAPPAGLAWDERLRVMAAGLRQTAHRHPSVFPLLLQRPATTAGSKRARDAVYLALAEAGVPPERVARAERLVSTMILGFLTSESGGRLAQHPRRLLDDDFARLQKIIGDFIEVESAVSGAPAGPRSATAPKGVRPARGVGRGQTT
jgi:AcrR family transcriptional regulator